MVLDGWVNIFPEAMSKGWTSKAENASVENLFKEDLRAKQTAEDLLAAMDESGVETAVLTSGLRDAEWTRRKGMYAAEDFLDLADAHPGRFLLAATVEKATKPVDNCRRVRELAEHPAMAMVRITPLVEQYELNHRLYYPVYATCAELGIPVSINVGIPGPQVRSRCQDPVLLEDVLIDFPTLTVVGAHMGHPYEALLIQYMLKWPQLFLMSSAYLAKYMDPALVQFMDSSRGRGRVWFASDHPVLPISKALAAAKELPLSDEAMAEFLGESARRVLGKRAS